MSLFKVRQLWATECGADETFDQHSLTVANLNGHGDKVVVGSHGGCVRVYDPHVDVKETGFRSAYKPTDLLMEMQLPSPVLQVVVGRLVSGSYHQHLCLLHPRCVAVYSLVTKPGEAEHGDQSHLVLAYEHRLQRSAACVVLGPFGGVKGRDFICVQSLDGTLSIFEQEMFAFHRFLPNFLLPGPLVFLPHTDSFVTVSSCWHVESYRYQVLAEAGGSADQESTSGKRVFPDWSYNLGEGALSVATMSWSATDGHILVLGQRNMYCLKDSGALSFMKRLEYRPCCFHPYFVEPDGRMMTLVVADTGALLVYERTRLRWCAQLEWLPTAICRANLQMVKGALVLLSDTGQLQCCYLGTQPSLFVPPPLEATTVDYQQAELQLKELNRIIKENTKANSASLADAAAEKELGVSVRLQLQQAGRGGEELPRCSVSVELMPQVPLSSVQLSTIVQAPLTARPVSQTISSLCEKKTVVSEVWLGDADCDVVPSLEVRVVVSYVVGAGGFPRVLQKLLQLPLKLALVLCPAAKEADFKITLSINQPAITLAQLFPELVADGSLASASTAVGFHVHGRPETVVSVLAAKSSQRYRLQTNCLPAAGLLVAQVESRLCAHFSKVTGFACSYASSLPMHQLFSAIDAHHNCRAAVHQLQEGLGRVAAQYRAVQRRLLTKLKERSPAPLAGLDVLLRETHRLLSTTVQQLDEARAALRQASCRLACVSSLVLLLLRLTDVTSTQDLRAALASCPQRSDDQGWEEVSDAAITYLLRTSLAKSDKDKEHTAPITLDFTKDTSRFKKHVSSAIDRLFKSIHVLRREDACGELLQPVSPIPEGEETPENSGKEEEVLPVSTRFIDRKQSAPLRGRSALQSALRTRLKGVQPPAHEPADADHENTDERHQPSDLPPVSTASVIPNDEDDDDDNIW